MGDLAVSAVGARATGEDGATRVAKARWQTLPGPPVEKNWRPRLVPKSTIQPQPPGASLLRMSTPVRDTYSDVHTFLHHT